MGTFFSSHREAHVGRRKLRVTGLCLVVIVLAGAVGGGGCELLYFAGGKGEQKALFVLPKKQRVLVLVDTRASAEPPPGFSTRLGEAISTHLYRFKAADNFVGQERLSNLRQDVTAFAKLGVADIARACDADCVVVVDVWDFSVTMSSDKAIIQGSAQAFVKVVANDGSRLWPVGIDAGTPVEAHVEPTLASEKERDSVIHDMLDLLTIRTGRMFHAYDLEDKQMIR